MLCLMSCNGIPTMTGSTLVSVIAALESASPAIDGSGCLSSSWAVISTEALEVIIVLKGTRWFDQIYMKIVKSQEDSHSSSIDPEQPVPVVHHESFILKRVDEVHMTFVLRPYALDAGRT